VLVRAAKLFARYTVTAPRGLEAHLLCGSRQEPGLPLGLAGEAGGAAFAGIDPGQAFHRVQQVKGPGLFAAELVVLRGANTPDGFPRSASGTARACSLAEVSEAWRPYRTWAAVHLRALREERAGEIVGRSATDIQQPGARARRPVSTGGRPPRRSSST